MTSSPNGSVYHCTTLQFLCCVYLSFHAYSHAYGQGLFFFLAEGRLLVILLHESCTNTSSFLVYFYCAVTVL